MVDRDDGFTLGANLPWCRYGGDFGANAWRPGGGLAAGAPAALPDALDRAARAGASIVRWFLFCDGRAGVRFDGRGRPSGIDDRVCADLDAALSAVDHAGLRAVLSLIDFLWCARPRRVNGVRTGGHRRVLASAAERAQLLDRVFGPILDRYGGHPAIAAWEVINEPEWVTRGFGTLNPFTSVSTPAMRAFIGDTAALVHARASQGVTVGSAHACWLPLVAGLGLDFYQVHWYDRLDRRLPITTPVASFGVDRPVVLGELPSRGSARRPEAVIELARSHGYAGAWVWSLLAEDTATDGAGAVAALRAAATRASRDRASGAP